ncbi:hypothetical protein [Salsipaludibacter albus]|uniref:hypothetical protein n=1 Tax=Salsipaludibacter albus TaxID=2849650 RepID=UPI001EE4B866|nr:hypothetical protein [Salsipaludibacter albus]MBY5162660.1 hypothetical protein [Salsipaludibacter albus]
MRHTTDHLRTRQLARRCLGWMQGWWREAVRGVALVAMAMATWWAAMLLVTVAATGAS